MTGSTRGEPAPEGMDIAAETLADLFDADGGVAGGMRRAGGFTDLDCTDYPGCDTSDCSELCEP